MNPEPSKTADGPGESGNVAGAEAGGNVDGAEARGVPAGRCSAPTSREGAECFTATFGVRSVDAHRIATWHRGEPEARGAPRW